MDKSKEQMLYDKFVDTLNGILDDKPSAQHLSVILNFLKYCSVKKEEDDEDNLDNEPETNIRLPF